MRILQAAQLVDADQKNWSQQLDNVLMAYRMSVGRVTGENPFFLMYGRDPILPQDLRVAGISLNQRHIAAPRENCEEKRTGSLQGVLRQDPERRPVFTG